MALCAVVMRVITSSWWISTLECWMLGCEVLVRWRVGLLACAATRSVAMRRKMNALRRRREYSILNPARDVTDTSHTTGYCHNELKTSS
ncbi:unnamed protein product [Euphydryas editha]|uniref:Secreted protein n=1 Tax=Euphydryas editha TaxID=104508 RepID=A0AAU9U315_EUPED|nr:unnamed protein product [Euphydryas editha]